jgi:D-alanyl-D-alanine carboxypeptidase (penicillin-binding protein 5/6)
MHIPRRLAACCLLLSFFLSLPALAAFQAPEYRPYRSAIVMDPATGEILYEHNAHQPYPTASMVKMMTLLVVMDHVRSGDVSLDQPVTVSARSSLVGGSQVYLKQGEVFPLSELIAAVMIKSANDAAYLLAETVGGTVEEFVAEMNAKARELDLEDSHFYTPHGLPPENPGQRDDVMTARDLAIVGSRVLRDPVLSELARTNYRPFRNGEFNLRNSNHLLRKWDRAIGIKTGWTRTADFCLTAAAEENGLQLISVVQGVRQKWDSFDSARALLEEGFDQYELVTLAERGDPLLQQAPVAGGERDTVRVVALARVRAMVRKDRPLDVRPAILSRRPQAPIRAGQEVGTAVYRSDSRILAQVPVAAAEPVAELPWWSRFWREILTLLA